MRVLAHLLLGGLILGTSAAEPLSDIKVLNDCAPNCSSLKSIVESVTRGCETDDEKAIALYNFCRYAYYHHAYPNEPGGISALKMINVYGWSLCGGQHTVLAALWEAAGYKHRYRGWTNPGHTTVEVWYGGKWHYFDTFLKFYAWRPDPQAPGGRTVASQEDILAKPELVTEGFTMDQERNVCYHSDNRFDYYGDTVNWTAPAFMVCGDTLDGVLSGVRSSHDAGSPRAWNAIRFDGPDYSTAVNLAPGYTLTLNWDREEDGFYFGKREQGAHHTCGDKDYRNCPAIGPLLEPYRGLRPERSWSNGRLVFRPDLRTEACLSALRQANNVAWSAGELRLEDDSEPARFLVEMASPYVVAKASARVECDDCKVEVSRDQQRWTAADGVDTTASARGAYRYFVRFTFHKSIRGIEVTSVVQHNQEALPYLAPGMNTITIGAANPEALGPNRLVVTYAYCLGQRDQTPAGVFDRGAEIARAHYASWSDRPVVVQQVVDKLPCTFEIPVPTPKDKQPVYPRMLFLRREVLAPGQQPVPTPLPPSTPKVGADEYLATLPNPWTMGTKKPPAAPERPTRTEALLPTKTLYASRDGQTYEHKFVKWLKDDSNAWILLVDFDRGELPELKTLASAKLVLHVHESHDKAPMKAAAVALNVPFEVGKAYDFSQLGPTVGWTVVERGNGPGQPFVPPRRYEIDVTREIRRWVKGEEANGFAIRILPSRGIDDGWTVRFTPAKERPVELAVATFVEE